MLSATNDETSTRFSTADLPLAQLLVAHGYEPIIRLLNERFCSFEFPSDNTIEQLVTSYQRGEALAEPRSLKAAEYRLRRAIDQVREGGAQ